MKNELHLSIPRPCNQNWNTFTPTAKGGFCASCAKEVIDFTGWSDDRIKAYFTQATGSTCGRFRPAQLTTYSLEPAQSRTPWLRALVASALLLLTSRQLLAQTSLHPKPQQEQQHNRTLGEAVPLPQKIHVRGVITYQEDGSTLPGVNVVLKGTSVATVTDGEGRFTFTIAKPRATEILVLSFIGLETKEYVLTQDAEQQVAWTMKLDETQMNEMVVVGGCAPRLSVRRLWWRIWN